MITTKTDTTPSVVGIEARNGFKMALTAFLAILRRDILVTRRQFVTFLLQAFLQPVFFLFVFGTILPAIGIAEKGYGAVLLPGIVTLSVFIPAAQGVMLPLVMDLGYTREIDDRLLATDLFRQARKRNELRNLATLLHQDQRLQKMFSDYMDMLDESNE